MTIYRLSLIILSFFLISCNGYDSEQLEELNSQGSEINNGSSEEPDINPEPGEEVDPDGDPIESEPPVEEVGPVQCIKSLHHNMGGFFELDSIQLKACRRASSRQLASVEDGNTKREAFLERCYEETGGSCWCDQLTRPNPSSINTFRCTYGNELPHQLIHPDEKTWDFAIEAAKIVLELEQKNIAVSIIYNWWRPEPYNKNVGGAAGRHPFGTSIDVRFVRKSDQEKAFLELCKMRKKGRIRAVGYYSSSALHFGVGDHTGNTWGKACPR